MGKRKTTLMTSTVVVIIQAYGVPSQVVTHHLVVELLAVLMPFISIQVVLVMQRLIQWLLDLEVP